MHVVIDTIFNTLLLVIPLVDCAQYLQSRFGSMVGIFYFILPRGGGGGGGVIDNAGNQSTFNTNGLVSTNCGVHV